MSNSLVYVKSVVRPSIQKRTDYEVDGVKVNKTKAKGAKTQLKVQRSASTKRLKTGLTEVIDNPYYKSQASDMPSSWSFEDWNKVTELEEIPRQWVMEIKHNVPKGTYRDDPFPFEITNNYVPTYMQKLRIYLNDGTTIFDRNIPEQEIMYYALLATDKVALSFDEVGPKQYFYISRVNEEEERTAKKREQIDEAIYNSVVLRRESGVGIKEMLAKSLDIISGDVSDEAIDNKISMFINTPDSTQLERVRKFNKFFEKTKTPDGVEELKARSLIKDLLHYNIVTNYQGEYIWHTAPSQELKSLGKSEAHTLRWFLDKERKEFVDMLVDELQDKKNRRRY